ncbi:lysophospholipid acyltransferase family protein [Desulforamulus putei]|uniref:1-acyl-sn-glycerol-3-phosphate acyltransferase n=1 Tax=Desulforamulus putei DSM 12395 TaxID=1121429 RepID=A0A1M5CTL3_9FIRM|nr:lysophospholipid acyltransferase family protein [Desulforamulus putei]SHF57672.1 1-acyl-sn-glycerol-3-phosphate acyltransferase [Desulforamulus putei DSM 12395]
MKPFFSGTTYDTPDDQPRLLMDRLFLGTRCFFVGGYINEIIKARSLAVKDCYDNKAWAESSYRVFKLIEGCGGRFHLRGLDNIRNCQKPVVFVSNHMSTLETFVFPCIILPFAKVTFVVKESLVKHPLFGPVMRSCDPIVVSRNNPRQDFQTVMTKGKELLAKGTSIVIFPQSTRTTKFIPEEFNSLGIKLAKAAGVQVIPVAIKTDFWGNGKFIKDIGPINREKHIHMFFGPPFFFEGSGKEEHKRTVEFILTNLKAWENIV